MKFLTSALRPAFATPAPLAPSLNPLLPHPPTRTLSHPNRAAKSTPTATIILAPGQGAQFPNMGASWLESSKPAAQVLTLADTILQTSLETPLSTLLASAPPETLSRTDIAQPAIFATSMACWAGLQEKNLVSASSLTATAGLSLGEYTALTVANVLSFEDALRLVALRGRAMQEAAESSDGAMVALLGATEEVALSVVEQARGDDVLVAANFNAPGQVVLSGSTAAVDRAAKYAKEELKLRVAMLDVAGAFHSPLMQPAADQLEAALNDVEIRLPVVPVMSNVTGEPHTVGRIRELLVKQLTNPVRWADCVTYLRGEEGLGGGAQNWVELAPGKTLSGIMRKIDRKVKVANYDQMPVEAS